MTEETLAIIIAKALDEIGAELKIWNEDYFGTRPEEELTKKLAHKIIEKINEK